MTNNPEVRFPITRFKLRHYHADRLKLRHLFLLDGRLVRRNRQDPVLYRSIRDIEVPGKNRSLLSIPAPEYHGSMKNLSRRDLCSALPALALLGGVLADNAFAGAQTGQALPARSEAFQFDKLPVNSSPNGAATRPVLRGTLPTGETIELHETTLMPGQMPTLHTSMCTPS